MFKIIILKFKNLNKKKNSIKKQKNKKAPVHQIVVVVVAYDHRWNKYIRDTWVNMHVYHKLNYDHLIVVP